MESTEQLSRGKISPSERLSTGFEASLITVVMELNGVRGRKGGASAASFVWPSRIRAVFSVTDVSHKICICVMYLWAGIAKSV